MPDIWREPHVPDDRREPLKPTRESTGDALALFIRSLWASEDYFVPVHPDPMEFALVADQNGGRYLPAFTSMAEFRKAPVPCGGVAVMPFEALCRAVVGDRTLSGVAVNLFSAAFVLSRKDLAAMEIAASGMTREQTDRMGQIFLESARRAPSPARAFAEALEIFEEPDEKCPERPPPH